MLNPPELEFSGILKNLLDASAFTSLDALVQIFEGPT
jgi:hypothetical protein